MPPAPGHPTRQPTGVVGTREDAVSRVVIVRGQAELLDVVDALRASCRFAGRLHGGQQQGDQHANDRNHDQKFDQRETTPTLRRLG